MLDIFGIREVLFGLFLVWLAFRLLFFGLICIWVNGDIPCCLFNSFFSLKKKKRGKFISPLFFGLFLELSVCGGLRELYPTYAVAVRVETAIKVVVVVSQSKRKEEYEKSYKKQSEEFEVAILPLCCQTTLFLRCS